MIRLKRTEEIADNVIAYTSISDTWSENSSKAYIMYFFFNDILSLFYDYTK